jgi:hypothetical protein
VTSVGVGLSVRERGGGGILLVGDGCQPVHDVVVCITLVDRDVHHETGGGGAVSVLLVGLDEDAVAGTDDLDRPAAALAEADALRDEDGCSRGGGASACGLRA